MTPSKVRIIADGYSQELDLEENKSSKLIADENLIGKAFDIEIVDLGGNNIKKESIFLPTSHEGLFKVYSNPEQTPEEQDGCNDSFSLNRQ